MAGAPLVMYVEQAGSDQADDNGVVREDASDAAATLDLPLLTRSSGLVDQILRKCARETR